MVFVRKVKTGSGATAVQIAERVGGRDRVIEHLGSAHTDGELTALLETARHKMHPEQGELDLSPGTAGVGPSVITGHQHQRLPADLPARDPRRTAGRPRRPRRPAAKALRQMAELRSHDAT
nr:hypothetical protein [Demetria terragena]